ncbi:type II toxin-antitoxin system RelE/ParE family toxin [Nitratireductor mangrovi]|uniref:Type II toxin-antitoxin system RelE/ParE family toxin n=1 Tax=Nitratireductor mangrovi TaxID=2599600 RepID=A0A5B8KU66_9HYPH|nr:type II toxin-antitoxin system RelE/ParE family toxin [Nitratireductor mangrovi]QDY99131.1 type II toxin-antitoxin system RelE/ParE family toxin [Nitratireductor mangrovi]
MKTSLSPAALADLAEILKLLATESPSAARGFRERFRNVRTLLANYPAVGRQTDDPSLRCVNPGRYPYLVFFEVVGTQVVIMRIMHGARDPRSMPATPS